jgi:uncharacterized protein YhaN
MKISELHVDGFGVWSGLSVEELSDKLTVFYGRNEAGKTTLMQYVRTILYGFSPHRRGRYLPPVHGGRPGGTLSVASPNGDFQIQRIAGLDDAPGELGQVTIHTADGSPQGAQFLEVLLAGVDEPIFNNVFAVGLREMQELATLNDTQAADQLYKLTSGLDRVSLVDVLRELNLSRNRLLSADDRPSQITLLAAQRDTLQAEVDELIAHGARWPHLAEQRDALRQEVGQLEQSIRQLEQQARTVEVALQVREPWHERQALNEQLAALGTLPTLPDRAIERLDWFNRKIKQRRKRPAQLKRERADLRAEAAEQPINRPLWAQAARIEALSELTPWIASLEDQVEKLQQEVTSLQGDCDAQYGPLDLPAGTTPSQLAGLSQHTLSVLRGPARKLRDETQRLVEAQRERETSLKEAKRLAEDLELAVADRGHADLGEALESGGTRVSQLRRRLQLEERIDQLGRSRNDLEDESHELLERQVLPPWVLAGLGALFVVGVMLILTGLLGGWLLSLAGGLGWTLALLGFGGMAVSIVAKLVLERSARANLEACHRQLEVIEKQIESAKRERDELDQELPRGGGQLDSRLQTAEAELKELEELLPLDVQRQAAQQHADSAELRVAQATEAAQASRQRWRAALRSVGLPETLSPKSLKQLAASTEQASHLRRRLEHRREELQQRERELLSLAGRIEQLFSDAGLKPASDSPQLQLRQLSAALAEQQQLFDRRAALRRQDHKLRNQQKRYTRGVRKLRRRRHAMLAAAGVSDEQAFRQLAVEHSRSQTLLRQRNELSSRITTAIGTHCSEEAVAGELANPHDKLEQKWDELVARLSQSQSRLGQVHQRRGEVIQEMSSLVEDRRLAEAKLELGCVEHQLQSAIHRWQVLATTGLLLETIRELYETQRQPETLREASTYLSQLTRGHYTRVWTPLGQQVLRVDDADGKTLPLEVLSRGTREAVFLSLRLALVACYARRGAVLPLVLDDVLVNFDADRAKAAATVLRDFAKSGFQLLLFTCHEHIMKMFKSIKAEIRQLPNHAELVQARQAALAPRLPEPELEPELEPEPMPIEVEAEEEEEVEVVVAAVEEPDDEPLVEVSDESELWLADDTEEALEVEQFEDDEDEQQVEEDSADEQWEEVEAFDDDLPAAPSKPQPAAPHLNAQRAFTWDSPEIYWENDREHAA